MGLTRTIGAAVLLAGAFGAGMTAAPSTGHAQDGSVVIDAGSVDRVQLLGPQRMLTEEEATLLLQAEGFVIVEMGRTLLGRIRIIAEGPQGTREIVLHPSDGRVLRDIFTEAERPTAVILPAPPLVEPPTIALTPEPPMVVVDEPPVEVQIVPPSDAPTEVVAGPPAVPPEVPSELPPEVPPELPPEASPEVVAEAAP